MQAVEATYTVALRDYPEDLPAVQREKVEKRYARELERVFGGPEQVAEALETMEALESSAPDVLSPGELSVVKLWGKASTAAREAALRDLGDADGTYFDVRRA